MKKLLYLIDTYSLVFQVYHAIAEMTGPKGQPTNAVFGFTRDLQRIRDEKKPTHLICAMETSTAGVRGEWFPEYKAHRDEMPADLRPQVPLILRVMEGVRVPCVDHAGWEADDVIATLTRKAVAEGFDVRIVTSDKDARQLLGPNVKLFNVRKNTELGVDELKADWGIRPDQAIDFQAMVGDSVDNVPGVPLVGPKKAQALLEQFGTLDAVLANADKVKGAKLAENLKTFADQALLSRRLVTLNTELPIEIDWDNARVVEPDRPKLLELFTELGFKRLSDDMRDGQEAAPVEATKQERDWRTVDTPKKFDAFLKELKKQKAFCVDLETTSINPTEADIVGWAFSWNAGTAWYLPVDCPPGQAKLDCEEVVRSLKPILEDPKVAISNQNIKYDMIVLRNVGIQLQQVGMDPMVGDYLLDAGARSHGLDNIAVKYLDHRMIPISDLIGTGKQQKKMFEVDVDKAAEYAAEDADIAWQLTEKLTAELKKEGLWELYWDLERPLIPVLADMEYKGIKVDVAELASQSRDVGSRLEQLISQIYEAAGHEFNIDSPKQLSVVLHDELALPVMKRTKTGASTSHEVLEKLAPLHPLPALIIDHRQLSKLKGTYLDALPQLVNPRTGKIHTSFSQVTAATGRLSSSDPNLQNIPIRSEEGRRIRRAFIPSEPGWKLVSADYSQIELRVLAHFSGDEAMQSAFREGADIHTSVASEIFSVDPQQVTSEMRRVAKAVNFGVIYGQSPFGLAEALRIPQDEAARFINEYFTKYSGVDRYLESILVECERTGHARTILGRRRGITGIRNFGGRQRNLPERTAINTVIQGSAADMIKKAMINVYDRLAREKSPARMLLQIHDELLFESPEAEVPKLAKLVREEMEHALKLTVPIVVDVKVGDNWLAAEAYVAN